MTVATALEAHALALVEAFGDLHDEGAEDACARALRALDHDAELFNREALKALDAARAALVRPLGEINTLDARAEIAQVLVELARFERTRTAAAFVGRRG